nr:carbon-nitrogen hydrolase family protein [Candidatus Sigynarchaeota archaeon]
MAKKARTMQKLAIKVGIIQPNTRKLDIPYNMSLLEKLATIAAKKGAKIDCTPECMLDGYSFDDPAFQANPDAYCIDLASSPIARRCGDLTQRLGLYLIVGMSIKEQGQPPRYRNAAILFSPNGEVEGMYFKVHSTFDNVEAKFYKHGEGFPTFNVTPDGIATKVGIMICYDRQMPESARALRVNGAEIIFNPSATNNFRHAWNTRLLQTRAYENKWYVVSVNHAWPRRNGRSLAIHPRGTILARCLLNRSRLSKRK